jgi:hypothetical protein
MLKNFTQILEEKWCFWCGEILFQPERVPLTKSLLAQHTRLKSNYPVCFSVDCHVILANRNPPSRRNVHALGQRARPSQIDSCHKAEQLMAQRNKALNFQAQVLLHKRGRHREERRP